MGRRRGRLPLHHDTRCSMRCRHALRHAASVIGCCRCVSCMPRACCRSALWQCTQVHLQNAERRSMDMPRGGCPPLRGPRCHGPAGMRICLMTGATKLLWGFQAAAPTCKTNSDACKKDQHEAWDAWHAIKGKQCLKAKMITFKDWVAWEPYSLLTFM